MYSILGIIVCLILFGIYVYVDYHKYIFVKEREAFSLDGHPNNTDNAPIPYSYIARAIKNPNTMKEEDPNKTLLTEILTKDTLNKINSRELDKYYNMNKIEYDLKYFNNSTILMEQNWNNDIGYLEKHFENVE